MGMNDFDKIRKDPELKELDEGVDKLHGAFERGMGSFVLIGSGIAFLIALALFLTGHPILCMLAGFAAVVGFFVGLILMIPHKL